MLRGGRRASRLPPRPLPTATPAPPLPLAALLPATFSSTGEDLPLDWYGHMKRPMLGPFALLLLLAAGCAGGDRPDEPGTPLLILAAASLNTTMPALIDAWQAEHPGEIDLVLGSTGNLAAQIENGAPADLFFAADVATVERLAGEGEIEPGSVRRYGSGELALIAREGGRLPDHLGELGDPEFEVIAIANPEHAPYGMAARQALERAGLWTVVEPRIVYGENVAQTYQLARTGNADVALVARSVLAEGEGWTELEAGLYDPIEQAAGRLAESTHPAAEPFLDFVLSPAGQDVLAATGFRPAG